MCQTDARPVLIKEDKLDGYIYVCPYCHYYMCLLGFNATEKCDHCGSVVDIEHEVRWEGPVKYE